MIKKDETNKSRPNKYSYFYGLSILVPFLSYISNFLINVYIHLNNATNFSTPESQIQEDRGIVKKRSDSYNKYCKSFTTQTPFGRTNTLENHIFTQPDLVCSSLSLGTSLDFTVLTEAGAE